MEEPEIEELLGAYVLDAVSPEEASEIERHLAECPRCRAEVENHREVAALLGHVGAEAPGGLWERIAVGLEEEPPTMTVGLPSRPSSPMLRSPTRRLVLWGSAGLGAAAVLLVIALLGLQIVQLGNQVDQYKAAARSGGLTAAAKTVLVGPHRTVVLASESSGRSARLVVAPDDEAYWVGSDLRRLPSDHTYQLWALADGRVVSVGLVGQDPVGYSAFRLEPDMTRLMVTAEPEGGTVQPTTPVLVQGTLAD